MLAGGMSEGVKEVFGFLVEPERQDRFSFYRADLSEIGVAASIFEATRMELCYTESARHQLPAPTRFHAVDG